MTAVLGASSRAAGLRSGGVLLGLAWLALAALIAAQGLWKTVLSALFPNIRTPVYERNTLLELTLQHLSLTLEAMLIVLVVGGVLGIWVTRRSGRAFLPLVNNIITVGQTFPPVAVLFLALPILGFGSKAALVALVAYALLPVTRGLILGLQSVPPEVQDAAKGLGLSESRRLTRLELPFARPAMMAGIRTALVLTIATTALTPLVGTGGLGVPIIAGLGADNLALILQGAIPVALLAILSDLTLRHLEQRWTPWMSV